MRKSKNKSVIRKEWQSASHRTMVESMLIHIALSEPKLSLSKRERRSKTPLGRDKFIHTYLTSGTLTRNDLSGTHTKWMVFAWGAFTPFVMLSLSTFNFSNVVFVTAVCVCDCALCEYWSFVLFSALFAKMQSVYCFFCRQMKCIKMMDTSFNEIFFLDKTFLSHSARLHCAIEWLLMFISSEKNKFL